MDSKITCYPALLGCKLSHLLWTRICVGSKSDPEQDLCNIQTQNQTLNSDHECRERSSGGVSLEGQPPLKKAASARPDSRISAEPSPAAGSRLAPRISPGN